MSSSTALARVPVDRNEEAGAEKMPAVTSLAVPAALLLAAASVTAKPGGPRTYLEGVFVHAKGDKGRVVGTDGARMFIASFPLPTKVEGGTPPWMHQGVIISADNLRSRISLLGKLSSENDVRVGYAKGASFVDLSDTRQQTTFKVASMHGTFPEYENVLGAKSFSDLDDEGNQASREWQPVGINSSYLKQCGDIAKMLEAGLEKDKRSKLGMVVRAFNGGGADAPMVLDFSTWPGAILIVAPAVMATKVLSKETAQILAPAVKATVAALRAHATRWDQRAAEARGDVEKAEARAKAEEFRTRVNAVMASVPAGPMITGDKQTKQPKGSARPDAKAEAAPADESKPEEAKAEVETKAAEDSGDEKAEDEGRAKRPTVKRTRIKVPAAEQQHQAAA